MTRILNSTLSDREERRWKRLISGGGSRKVLCHNTEIAREIRAFQSAHNMTLKALADKLGVPYRTLQSWVDGAYPITHPKMLLLALSAISTRHR